MITDARGPVYDYENQAWIQGGKYVVCDHMDDCPCYGKAHAGELGRITRCPVCNGVYAGDCSSGDYLKHVQEHRNCDFDD